MGREVKTRQEHETAEWEFGKEWFEDLQSKIRYNVYQSEYYERMAEDFHDDGYRKKAERTLMCSKNWELDYYRQHGVKQIKSITRCHDAFCYVCQSLKAQRRHELYAPLLKALEKENDIYHIVFTVPNVTGERLNWTIDKMYDRRSRLMEYFRGSKKIKGLDFGQYGYRGAVCTLEVTAGTRSATQIDDFHPHFHCMFVLAKGAPNMEKVTTNAFSYTTDKKTGQRVVIPFSKFECLLQKIWCLLILGIEVTKDNIRNIYEVTDHRYKYGFDVKADRVEDGNYHEVFKYVVKGTYKKESIFSYEDFCYLENALRNRHVYQTYGCLKEYNFNDVDDIFLPKKNIDVYFELLLQELQRREKPQLVQSCIEEILSDLDKNKKRKRPIRYIGPTTLRNAFRGMNEAEQEICFEKMCKTILGGNKECNE